jgi:predicted HTH domain antitoxin
LEFSRSSSIVPEACIINALRRRVGISGPAGRISLERLSELAAITKTIGQELTDRLSFKP